MEALPFQSSTNEMTSNDEKKQHSASPGAGLALPWTGGMKKGEPASTWPPSKPRRTPKPRSPLPWRAAEQAVGRHVWLEGPEHEQDE